MVVVVTVRVVSKWHRVAVVDRILRAESSQKGWRVVCCMVAACSVYVSMPCPVCCKQGEVVRLHCDNVKVGNKLLTDGSTCKSSC